MAISKTTGILILLGLLVLAAAGYMLFGSSSASPISAQGAPSSPAEAEFLALTQKIEGLEFDQSVLADPRFLRLVDIRTAIIPEQAGRPDPFAPLPGVRSGN